MNLKQELLHKMPDEELVQTFNATKYLETIKLLNLFYIYL